MSSMTIHLCPPKGSGLMPCCNRTPFEVPRTDRMTLERRNVTCHALAPTTTPPRTHGGDNDSADGGAEGRQA